MNVYQLIANLAPSRFQHDRGVQSAKPDSRIRSCRFDFIPDAPADVRMYDRFQRFPLHAVGEDDSAHSAAIEFTALAENLPAPAPHQGVADRRLPQGFVPEFAGTYDYRPCLGEFRRHSALAATHAAEQANHELYAHRLVHDCREFSRITEVTLGFSRASCPLSFGWICLTRL